MQMRKLFVIALGLAVSNAAWAADPVPGLMTQWEAITSGFGTMMVNVGAKLLFLLLGLQFTLNGLNALRRGHELPQMVGTFVGSMLTSTFFFAMITLSPSWFPKILAEWNSIGGHATNTGPLNPGAIFGMGISIVETIRSTVAAKSGSSLPDFLRSAAMGFQILFVELFILLAFLVLAGQLALAMLRGYLWLCIGPVLLGFGSLSFTKDIAVHTLKSGISIGVTILTCYVISAVARASTDIFSVQIARFTLDNWVPLWNCVGVSALIALASWQVPKIANDFINGGISGGVGETMATAGVAAAGAGAMTGGVGGVLANAGTSAVANLAGLAQAGSTGMSAAHDLGKSGFAAAGHALKEVAGHGSSVVGGGIRDTLGGSASNLKQNAAETLGGRTAQSIEAGRGGSFTNASSSPNSQGQTKGAAASVPGDGPLAQPSGGDISGPSAADSSQPTTGESDMSRSNPLGVDSHFSNSDMGQASTASFQDPSSNSSGISNEELGKQLQAVAQSMSSPEPTIAQKLRDATSYIPNEQQSVGVNANLGGGQAE